MTGPERVEIRGQIGSVNFSLEAEEQGRRGLQALASALTRIDADVREGAPWERPRAVLAARGGLVSGLGYGWGTESIPGMQSSDECVDSDNRPPRLPDQLLQIVDIGLKVGSESRRR